MKKIVFFLFNILMVYCLHSQGRFSDLKIIESDDNHLLIEFTPQYDSIKVIKINGMDYQLFGFSDSRSLDISKSGSPDIASRNITLGLPTAEGNKVEFAGGDYESIRNINFAPIATYTKSDDSIGYGRSYRTDEKVYRTNAFYPSLISDMVNIGIARDNILGTLRIFPLQYNPVTKELRKYSKIRIRVTFGANKSVSLNRLNTVKGGSNLMKNLVLNYDQSSLWSYAPKMKKLNAVKNSVLNSGTWYKIEVKEDGIYKLDANFFKNAGISLSGIDPRTLKIYGNGGKQLPEEQDVPVIDDLLECAIYASGESDGAFNDADYFLFYGQSPDTWVYDSKQKKFRHFINHYSTSNYYFLTFGGADRGKRATAFASGTSANPVVAANLSGKTFIEPEKTNILKSGRQWYGNPLLSLYPSITYSTSKLDGIVSSEPIKYRFVVGAASTDRSSFKIEQNSTQLGTAYVNYPVYSDYWIKLEVSDTTEFVKTSTAADGKINLKITYNPNFSGDVGNLDWVEIFYKRGITTTVDEIKFDLPDTTANFEYNLSGFSNSNIVVFDVSDHNNPKVLSNPNISAGNIKFQLKASAGSSPEIYVVGNNGTKSPVTVSKISNSNLHGIADGSPMILIVPNDNDFISEAERYKKLREASVKNPQKTTIVNLQNIYNEFSSGKQDPTAIRNFLSYAYTNWLTKPAYVLILGDGSYDYKNLINNQNFSQLNRVPVYETIESHHEIYSYTTDDYFVRVVGNDSRNDMAIGRITAISKEDASAAIDKIIAYENAPMNSWRSNLTFVADDGLLANGDDDESRYTDQSESLAELFTPLQFDKNKIYIIDYKTVVTSSGRTKPEANQDIIKIINNGTLLMNYIGHGNPKLWAHESIMRNESTIPALSNSEKLPFLVAATCDFGRFDNPNEQSGTELFILRKNAGFIGVFSASRSVFANENFEINKEFITLLFLRSQNSNFTSLGDIHYSIKQDFFSANDSKFHLFGDPCLVLNIPNYISEIDTINSISGNQTIQLKAQSKVNLKGFVRGTLTPVNGNYNGRVQIVVFDAPKRVEISEGSGYFVFDKPGGIIYSGECSIKNGRFEANFIVPKDISYENRNGKISMYFYNSDKDGYGYNSNIIISGTDTSGVTDETGPVANLYLNDRNFRSGDLVGENPLLIVDLYDESGINTTGLGVGHRFEAFLNNNTEGILLNSFYKGKIDSYSEGSAEYQLEKIPDGNHKLKVKVYDVFNNASSGEIAFKVQNTEALSLMNVMNYPNPFSKTTKFTMQQNQNQPIDATIKIFTIAGRLIKVINEYGITASFVQIEWDGRDEDGDEIANGVYLYKVITKTQDGKFTSEALGKLSVLK